MITAKQTIWNKKQHEAGVEIFYGTGVANYGDFHGGYLNFGLWTEGLADYLSAAENLVRAMGEMLGLNQESRLLDVANGMGTQDIYLARQFNCAEIHTVDATWPHLAHTERRVKEAGLENKIFPHHGTATNLPFADSSFTSLLCIEGAEHFNTREKFLREAYRVLRPGGSIALADYVLKRDPKNLYEHLVVEAARILWHVPRENYDSVPTYKTKLERAGFKNISLDLVGQDTIPGYYVEQRRPEVRRELARIRGFIGGRLGWVVDYAVYKAFKDGLIEYVLVRAEK